MHARALSKVLESRSSKFQAGDMVTGQVGWVQYAILDDQMPGLNKVSELPGGLSMTHYLGTFGSTGLTAYYGFVVIAEAKAEDVVVVSGAAGATGSMVSQFPSRSTRNLPGYRQVIQIAKNIIGCKKVIGLAGSSEKCNWVESIGADTCLNYKDPDFNDKLIKATDGFVDVYFDNVGGEILDVMLSRMARYGRIAACGAISAYNSSPDQLYGIKNWFEVISMRLQIRGFIVTDFIPRAGEALGTFRKALQEGKLKIGDENEHVVDTKFEDVPKTWMKLFEGGNTGKLITKLV